MPIEQINTIIFGLACLHTFLVKQFQLQAKKYKEGSIGENLFHLLGEVEVVFGLWAGVFVLLYVFLKGSYTATLYLESLNFTESIFVFVVMVVASSRPILILAEQLITVLSQVIPINKNLSFLLVSLIIGPLLGSLITEPAAMTVVALLLKSKYFDQKVSLKFKYACLAVLFVNVSIGGVLTSFAAPPVIMVASKFNWDSAYMMTHFGYRAILGTVINSLLLVSFFRKEISKIQILHKVKDKKNPPWLTIIHLVFLFLIVVNLHHPVIFVGLFLFFLGVAVITKEYQSELKLRDGLLVGFFLGGLVVFGKMQAWWLQPIIESISSTGLYFVATALTAVVDNAAITYLGAQVESLSDLMKYALVAGAVSGGGLTVIANAPNPAGLSILKSSFGDTGVSPLGLLISALIPTVIAILVFWVI